MVQTVGSHNSQTQALIVSSHALGARRDRAQARSRSRGPRALPGCTGALPLPGRRSATAARLAASAKSESRKCERLAVILQRDLPPARATELGCQEGSIASGDRSPTSEDEREALGHRAAEQLHAAAASFSLAARHYEAHRMQLLREESRSGLTAKAKSPAAVPPEEHPL